MYAEELILLIRQKASYNGPSHNDSGAWRAAIEKACEVINEALEHKVEPPVPPVSYVSTTPGPTKKFGKKKDEEVNNE